MASLSTMPILILGIVALAAVIAGVLAVIGMARRQAMQDTPPPSEPTDFVAPVSSGGYSWRRTDESAEDFKKRVARENADAGKKA